jgi:thioredoxin reductase (NADPH)
MKCLVVFLLSLFFSFSSFSLEKEKIEKQEIVVIGSGPGALTAAIYLARAGHTPLVIEGNLPGGAITQSHLVENWPGEISITGEKLSEKIRNQAEKIGVRFCNEEVISVDFSSRPFTIVSSSVFNPSAVRKIKADLCIIATGTKAKFLGIEGETGYNGYWGRGLSSCATCDGALYKQKVVGVIGGGDSALLEAEYLSNLANKVYVFIRKNHFKVKEQMRLDRLLKKKNVEVKYLTQVKKIIGNESNITHVLINDVSTEPSSSLVSLDGLFLAIGSNPNTSYFKQVKLDKNGHIIVNDEQQTSIPGVYAIGDVTNTSVHQAITAAGDGAKAAIHISKILDQKKGIVLKKSIDKENNVIAKVENIDIEEPVIDEVIYIKCKADFEREISNTRLPVFIEFYAKWCAPCKRISPVLDEYAVSLKGKAKILKVDVDRNNDISDKYGITSMPSFIVLKNEEVVLKKQGLTEIIKFLRNFEKNQSLK